MSQEAVTQKAVTRPVIGISCYVEPVSWGVWRDVPAVLLPHSYVACVQAAGGTALVLPPLPADASEADVRELLGRLDGLVIAGGADVDPGRYGEPPHPSAQDPRGDRDASELALALASAGSSLPVLGICRGMQVMAVAAGGSLEQHVPDLVGHSGHAPAAASYGSQRVRVEDGSLLREILDEEVVVPCYHHQGVRSHPGYRASARADDGVLEAFEDPAAPFRLGVQWHPERGEDPRLFRALVAAAKRAGVSHSSDHGDLGDH